MPIGNEVKLSLHRRLSLAPSQRNESESMTSGFLTGRAGDTATGPGPSPFHPPETVTGWGPPKLVPNDADPRWKAIQAWLYKWLPADLTWKMLTFRLDAAGLPHPGQAPTEHHLLFHRPQHGELEFEDQLVAYDLVYRDPDSLMTDLERFFAFGDPRRIEEEFRMPEVIPPPPLTVATPPVLLGQPISHIPNGYHCDSRWDPTGIVTAGEIIVQDGRRFRLYIQRDWAFFGKLRWFVEVTG